jgi:hypothetical protein
LNGEQHDDERGEVQRQICEQSADRRFPEPQSPRDEGEQGEEGGERPIDRIIEEIVAQF